MNTEQTSKNIFMYYQYSLLFKYLSAKLIQLLQQTLPRIDVPSKN